MKHSFSLLLLSVSIFFLSCGKEEYLRSESGVKSELQGTWKLIPIPKYDRIAGIQVVHEETWIFTDQTVSINMTNCQQSAQSTYSVNTSFSKAIVKIDDVQPKFTEPARVRDNNGSGSWQIIRLDDKFLIIANDQDGATGLTELEFEKM